LTSIRARVATIALIVILPAALGGCFGGGDGGGGGSEDPQQVLDQTFNNPTKVTSGHLNVSLSGSAQGAQSGNFTASIDGPFQGEEGNSTALPQLDLTAKISASGAGQSFSFDGGLIATQDDAYVEYRGQAYDVGKDTFAQFKKAYEQQAAAAEAQRNSQNATSIFKQFGIDPSTWLTNVTNEGDADVEGTDTIHVHGDADIGRIVADLGKVAQKAAPSGAAQAFTPAQLNQLKSSIQDASVDVYSGKDDHLLRKLGLSLTIAPPASAQSPVSSVHVDFSLTVSDVNQAQTITAPSSSQPIAGLLKQLGVGGIGPLGGLGGAGSTGGGAAPGAGPSQDYLKCVQQAQTADQINACASKIQ
jgi:hypothetical protein